MVVYWRRLTKKLRNWWNSNQGCPSFSSYPYLCHTSWFFWQRTYWKNNDGKNCPSIVTFMHVPVFELLTKFLDKFRLQEVSWRFFYVIQCNRKFCICMHSKWNHLLNNSIIVHNRKQIGWFNPFPMIQQSMVSRVRTSPDKKLKCIDSCASLIVKNF